jgi:phosphoribosylaminoimidazole-succinocarboxamide synthase
MTDHLEQQLINELRAMLIPINETYKDFFHVQMITLCDMKELKCSECKDSETGQQCKRCVIGFEAFDKQ